MIQQFTFDGVGRQIDARGTFFRYESGQDGSGVVDLRLFVDGNNLGTFTPGDSIELPEDGRRWEVRPVSSGCAGTVKIGYGKITSPRLQGVVQVVNGERQRVFSNQAFIGKVFTGDRVLPAVNTRSMAQIWNPADSGRNVWVSSVSMFATSSPAGTTQDWAYIGMSRALAILPNSDEALTQPMSKRLGGAAPVARFRALLANLAGAGQGTPPADVIAEGSVKIQTGFPLMMQEPVMLPPGFGLTFWGSAVGVDVLLQFTEEAV